MTAGQDADQDTLYVKRYGRLAKQVSKSENFSNFLGVDELQDCVALIITYATNAFHAHIRKSCPCNKYPPEPHLYIVKLGFAGVYLFFLFLL